jgi:hypothetical protein
MRNTLPATIAAVAMGLIGLAGLSAAQAMPVAPLDQVQVEASLITTVAEGCGVGRHRGPAGHCRPLYNCPAGFHSGAHGIHCYRDH